MKKPKPEKEAKKAKKKHDDEDDGRTVAPMSADWMPWNKMPGSSGKQPPRESRGTEHGSPPSDPGLTPSEKRAIVRGALLAHLPVLAGLALIIVLLYVLARLWLMPG